MKSYRCRISLLLLLPMVAGCPDSKTEQGPAEPAVDTATLISLELHSLKNRSLAAMENKLWSEAIDGFGQLCEELPNSRLALRNQAICHVLSLVDSTSTYKRSTQQEKSAFDSAARNARTAVVEYQSQIKTPFDQALAKLLLGKLLLRINDPKQPTFDEGLQLIREAANDAAERPDFAYAVVRAMESNARYANERNPGYQERLQQLKLVHKLNPDNLYVLMQLMSGLASGMRSPVEAVQQQASALPEILKTARAKLAPFFQSMKKQNRVDMQDMIDKALADYTPDKPMALYRPSQIIPNLMKAEIATAVDLRRIDRDMLEYVLTEFDDSSLPKITEDDWKVKSFRQINLANLMIGIQHLKVADLDLNGRPDFALIRNGRFEVLTTREDGSGLKLLMKAPENAAEITGFVLADIDRDYDQEVPDLKAPQLLLDRDGDIKLVKDPTEKRRWFDVDLDVVTWGPKGVAIYRNVIDSEGKRSLELLPQDIQLANVNDATAVDFDMDGDLDFAFATTQGIRLWRNLDRSSFDEAPFETNNQSISVTAIESVDWDRNLTPDLVATCSDDSGRLLQNIFHSRFRWMTDDPPITSLSKGGQLAVADLNADRSWDLVHASASGLRVLLTKRLGEVVDITADLPLSKETFLDVRTADFDNDGLKDIAALTPTGIVIFRNQFDRFTKVDTGTTCRNATSFDVFDGDNDGDIDLVAAHEDGLRFWSNEGGDENGFLKIVARGKPDDTQHPSRRVNAHGINAVLELRCGGAYLSHLIKEPVVHIGLGRCEKPDSIRIIWTDGVPQHVMTDNLMRPDIGILAPQILKGSCPYIYTWDGDQFSFFSDCLWAAPIGLVQANGEFAPTREWENLLIPGESLRERDGAYEIQLTEELWEIAYFDHVQLTAVDHPADIDIFTNEKVGPPELAAHKIHAVKDRRNFSMVTDGQGNDLTESVLHQDGDYVRAFSSRALQGLTEEWSLEFHSDDLKHSPENMRLFLTGWIFPTDTSLNQQILQDTNLMAPMPPVIEIPDADGQWKIVKPFVGFPSGKTKTMVVDLSDVFKDANVDRFRIRSTMELYFDQIFFDISKDESESRVQACELLDANLHYRGFSRRTYDAKSLFRGGAGPEGYDYQSVTTAPKWPPIDGRFTKYGPSTQLIREHDDRMVVMGPGDELTLRFDMPDQPIPDGWKRDFVLRNVGYDKDADLNTVYGQSSEPFPRKAMPVYPYLPEEVADSPEYKQFLREWQTRTYERSVFWNDPLRESRSHSNGQR